MLSNYINGQWVKSLATSSVNIINPATEKTLDQCPLGTREDVEYAIKAATEAFKSWKKVPAIERAQYLFKMKSVLEQNVEELARLVTTENGKTLVEARGSVRRGIQMIDTACGIPTLQMGKYSEDIAEGIDSFAVKKPMGVFAGIVPFNFPSMVPFWFWPFAIASGNTFILKPSERVPLTQNRIFELIQQTGLPKGVLNLVHGGKDVVNVLCTHPEIKGISFVGSTPIAKYVYQTGSASGKRVQALGGAKNFMVVLPDALMDKAIKTSLESIIGCAGERCLAGSVILCVGDQVYTEIQDKISRAASDVIIGDGLDPNTQMGPLISNEARERVKGLIQSAVDEGAKLLVDGRKNVAQTKGYFLRPSVIAGITKSMRVSREEIFGPVVLIAQIKNLDEAIEWINDCPYGNTTTLFTTSGAAARKFSYEVDPSMIGINIGVPAPMAFFSFGGSKDSFFGDIKAHGEASIDFFTDTKVTIQRWSADSSIW
ncbi:MAG: Methylmalonate-semialdehyde dehydrogenase [Bacteriovoracaceae bacterium]|nr:Methylmalonate-semialdehyde dehydrogenase [Bacteriovoracaceae bacterium]